MRLSEDVIAYFKLMADEQAVPYQSLINLYLRDCVASHRKIDIAWQTPALTQHASGTVQKRTLR
jgi:hypothetical protein